MRKRDFISPNILPPTMPPANHIARCCNLRGHCCYVRSLDEHQTIINLWPGITLRFGFQKRDDVIIIILPVSNWCIFLRLWQPFTRLCFKAKKGRLGQSEGVNSVCHACQWVQPATHHDRRQLVPVTCHINPAAFACTSWGMTLNGVKKTIAR